MNLSWVVSGRWANTHHALWDRPWTNIVSARWLHQFSSWNRTPSIHLFVADAHQGFYNESILLMGKKSDEDSTWTLQNQTTVCNRVEGVGEGGCEGESSECQDMFRSSYGSPQLASTLLQSFEWFQSKRLNQKQTRIIYHQSKEEENFFKSKEIDIHNEGWV